MESDPTLLVPLSLLFLVSQHVLRVGISICAPVVPVCFSPSPLGVPLILPVVRIVSHFPPVPSPLSFPLACRLRAIALILHPRVSIEQRTAGQTTTPLLQDTPHSKAVSHDASSLTPLVGQFREHCFKWVNFVSILVGGQYCEHRQVGQF